MKPQEAKGVAIGDTSNFEKKGFCLYNSYYFRNFSNLHLNSQNTLLKPNLISKT